MSYQYQILQYQQEKHPLKVVTFNNGKLDVNNMAKIKLYKLLFLPYYFLANFSLIRL